MRGFLLVDKPTGISSFKVVAIIRKAISEQIGQKIKVGHSGTLDPAASGLLLLAIGSYTKMISQFIAKDKTYEAEITLGKVSSTGDSEGDISNGSKNIPSKHDITKTLDDFLGQIEQTPPIFSAVKINGQRAYKLARQGKEVSIKPRMVIIYNSDLISYSYPILNIKAKVSAGTYIRSLAEDIGRELGCGAYLSALRRTSIGEFDVGSAIELQNINYSKIETNLITLDK
jgi:tRNA pseudouridine55 synthase